MNSRSTNEPLSRRTFLRGVGTVMALPFLEAMMPAASMAAGAVKAARPNRMAFIFVPNGIHMPTWTPAMEGAFELPATLQPLKNVKDNVSVLTGLAQHNAFALGDGGGDHARSAATFLTGCHPKKTDGADIKAGISADQLAAQKVGMRTAFPSLEIGCEGSGMSGNCDSGYSCAYSSNIAWKSDHQPLAKEIDPRLVFERLFGNGDPNETDESRARRANYKRSILDFVMQDANKLKSQLGRHDQQKLDEYFSGVREIEDRLARVAKISAENKDVFTNKPAGIPHEYGEHIRLMGDMMVLAFQADLTRVCTFMLANDGSNRNYKEVGVPEGHHDMSHHGGDKHKQEQVQAINKFHMTQIAYILEKMQNIKEGDSTLLDNSMIVYGAGISDGDRHNHDDLPLILAGKGAGTIKQGRHVRYAPNTPMNNLFLAMLDRMGVHAETIGDSTGRLEMLF